MKCRLCLVTSTVILATLGLATSARAEIVFLTSNRTLSVKSHRVEGDSIILTLRNGGAVTCDKSLIEKIVSDEVPYPEPSEVVAEALDETIPADGLLEATPYGEIISAISEAHGVDPLLVRALIQVESNYRPKAKSPRGAMGLMQLMPSTAREYKVRNPFDPRANIEAGIKHLKALLDRLGSTEMALAAYNAGEGAVTRFNGIPPYRETRDYVTRILALAGLK
jgi:Transglycosylase SLT domain